MKARLAALALLIPSLWAVGREFHSPIASALRLGLPLQAWILAKDSLGRPRLYWALYQPEPGRLDLIYISGVKPKRKESALEAARAALQNALPERPLPALPLIEIMDALPEQIDPALALKDRLGPNLNGISFWKSLPKSIRTAPASRFDGFILGLELRRLRPDDIRPAWLPEEPSRKVFLERLFSVQGRPEASAREQATAEVLNASGHKGVALEATKFLRSKGIDVVYFGNTAGVGQSVIYDRTGDVPTARMARRRLGCPRAAVVTQIQPDKMIDVTVLLAADCAALFPSRKE